MVPEIHKCPEFQYWKGLQAFPAIPEMSRNGNPGFSRDSRSSYRSCGNDNGTGEVRTVIGTGTRILRAKRRVRFWARTWIFGRWMQPRP